MPRGRGDDEQGELEIDRERVDGSDFISQSLLLLHMPQESQYSLLLPPDAGSSVIPEQLKGAWPCIHPIHYTRFPGSPAPANIKH